MDHIRSMRRPSFRSSSITQPRTNNLTLHLHRQRPTRPRMCQRTSPSPSRKQTMALSQERHKNLLELTQTDISSLKLKTDENILVISGPPCQDFSVAGSQRGTSGNRGQLLRAVTSLIATLQSTHKPVFYLIENVNPNLKQEKDGLTIYNELTRLLGTPIQCDAARFDSFAHRVRL
jgi:site-specific DNA-cytosine methylase